MTNSPYTQLMPATVEQSIQPLLTEVSSFKRFKGAYKLVGSTERIDKSGKAYWIIKLSDISTSINVYCFNMNEFVEQLTINSIVHIEATLKYVDGHQYVRCAFLQSLLGSVSNQLLSINLLPSCYCPAPETLLALKTLVDSLSSRHLSRFISDVLVSSDVGINYLQCPASLRHHHNFTGGLLAHSVDVAKTLLRENQFKGIERDIAIIAALIHDIGKTKTLSADGQRTHLGSLVDHDELTLEICAKAFARLDKFEPQSALLLRHILTCASPGSRYGYEAITTIASKLQIADKASAAAHYTPTSLAQIA
ncbi:HD domain-containing protein [Colwellia sp. RSH04]|uniref:HD domain-containing protein n=1 Tax=Colwellia sp. RSH04 TaxID=2305464 RepID=UPI000E59122C|nr:HD domain-containing protein [Colwellia sp. RSH04]RHW75009.1 HD domain-containing protein [Colwellia sp. RSH04]